MNKRFAIAVSAFLLMVVSLGATAQRRGQATAVNRWASAIAVDGDLSDWGEVLRDTHEAQSLEYELRNDRDFLYLAVRITQPERQLQTLSQGLQFAVNTSGRKREGPTLIFPRADRILLREIMETDPDERPADLRIGALQAVRGIEVQHFPRLVDGLISLDNHYGVRAVAAVDTSDALCVEWQIPLRLLELSTTDTSGELAYNLKINGVELPVLPAEPQTEDRTVYDPAWGDPYGRYRGYGWNDFPRPLDSGPRKETGIWGKFLLSTKPATQD